MCWKPRASKPEVEAGCGSTNVGSPLREDRHRDIAGPFPVTDAGNKYLLVAMDYFTRNGQKYMPYQTRRHLLLAGCLVNDSRLPVRGTPVSYTATKGRTSVLSILMRDVLQRLGVHKTRTTPLHPQSDGMVERYIKTLHLKVASDKMKARYDRTSQLSWIPGEQLWFWLYSPLRRKG
ncbi:uncharacterized protein LOC124373512, partial [Homalodisca vitripennis]|uniref:uncharacterized protein LOC124373512 n=1 Tax=Homalodisca vitripennis TaxID=197043 RepID=UPI001EEBA437